jgi:hypothetical protein
VPRHGPTGASDPRVIASPRRARSSLDRRVAWLDRVATRVDAARRALMLATARLDQVTSAIG